MFKLSAGEKRKLALKEKEWDAQKNGFYRFLHGSKKEIKIMKDHMMYFKKPQDKGDRFWHEATWWFFIVFIYFALRGFMYTLTGR